MCRSFSKNDMECYQLGSWTRKWSAILATLVFSAFLLHSTANFICILNNRERMQWPSGSPKQSLFWTLLSVCLLQRITIAIERWDVIPVGFVALIHTPRACYHSSSPRSVMVITIPTGKHPVFFSLNLSEFRCSSPSISFIPMRKNSDWPKS